MGRDSAAPSSESGRIREGGRSERVRQAVGDAVLSILAEGRWTFSTVEVAERAGVSRRTVYRWWPTHDDLLVEGLQRHVRRVPLPTSGVWETDLREFAHALSRFAADPVEVATGALVASRLHPEITATVVDHYRPVLAAWRQLAKRAGGREHGDHGLDPDILVGMLVSPLLMSPLMTGRPMRPEDVDKVVDVILAATRPR
ncbi:TetR/AcrR family transcriptional regulator [Dietzia psychralcaliphila]|uniref:TetR/AcrR family transcriptional regulator n=1 Tax=Dietzia psychralcaliphila TaxID=139021 RepID=UPI001C1E5065|nr:TetR/AcrR family transcriptional regulator [Dietzia psychralcaliphila]